MMTLLLFAAVAAAPSNAAHPAWMLGTWGWQNQGEQNNDCNSDHDTTYHRDGRYDFMDETGFWRIEGDRLIETMTDPGGTGDPALRGRPQVTHFRRISPGVLEVVAGRYPGKLIKCPAS